MNEKRKVIALGFFDGVHLGHQALLRKTAERALERDLEPAVFTFDRSPRAVVTGVPVPLLTTPEERALIKMLSQLPETIRTAARAYDPSQIDRYLIALAGDFHRFYNACRIKGEEPALLAARLKLADAARSVLKNGLALIGVDAPEHM